MKRSIIFTTLCIPLLLMLIAGCSSGGEMYGTPTPISPGEVMLTMAAQSVNAQATEMAVNIQFTATQQIKDATATQQQSYALATGTQQARMDAQATDQQARRDAAATQARIDAEATAEQNKRDAAATAEQMRIDALGTQSANATATWVVMTMTAMPPHATMTQLAMEQSVEIGQDEVELSGLKVKRQQQSNTLQALAPYTLAIGVFAMAALIMVRRSRVREVRNPETGGVELLIFDNQRGVQPNLLTGPVVEIEKGNVAVPLLADPAEQAEVTRREQAIRALQAMPSNPPTNAVMMSNGVFGETRKPTVEVLEPGQASRQILDELTGQVVEEEE